MCDVISFAWQVSCKVLQFFHQYMLGCNYFWMLCEGIYLHTLIVVAVFAEEQRLHWYYLLGWGMYGVLFSKLVNASDVCVVFTLLSHSLGLSSWVLSLSAFVCMSLQSHKNINSCQYLLLAAPWDLLKEMFKLC